MIITDKSINHRCAFASVGDLTADLNTARARIAELERQLAARDRAIERLEATRRQDRADWLRERAQRGRLPGGISRIGRD